MATEITNAGYQSLRDFVQQEWTFIELRDEVGSAIVRLGVDDERVSWEHIGGSGTLELKVVITGSDSEMTLPRTFQSSAIFTQAEGGVEMAEESFSPFTMEETGDELTVIHQLEIPQVV